MSRSLSRHSGSLFILRSRGSQWRQRGGGASSQWHIFSDFTLWRKGEGAYFIKANVCSKSRGIVAYLNNHSA